MVYKRKRKSSSSESGYSSGPSRKRVRASPQRRSMVSRGLSAVAPYVAAAAGPYGRLAYTGYKLARGAYKLYKGSQKSGKGLRYQTQGTYHGKFNKRGSLKKKESIYANKGVVRTSEVIGTVADPDCVYITHTAVDGYKLVDVAVQALVRKLFEKQGYRITNVNEVLGHISISDAKDWQIELTQINGSTGVESVLFAYVTVAGSTIASIAAQFVTSFMNFSSGATTVPGLGAAANELRLYRFILYGQDFNVTRTPVYETELRLGDEIMCVYGCSEIKIQNRTLSATGSTSTEDVSNNPLIGRMYLFNQIPKMRDKSAFPLNSIPIANGVKLVRAASLTGNTTFKEPPLPQLFTNVVKSSKIRLEPGGIKSSKCSYQRNMSFLTFLEKVKLQYGNTAEFLSYQSIFPCEMFALEDLINVNVSQNISLAYESNQVLGVYFRSRKSMYGVSTFDSITYNNVPA